MQSIAIYINYIHNAIDNIYSGHKALHIFGQGISRNAKHFSFSNQNYVSFAHLFKPFSVLIKRGYMFGSRVK